jgi:hypothetical protein
MQRPHKNPPRENKLTLIFNPTKILKPDLPKNTLNGIIVS